MKKTILFILLSVLFFGVFVFLNLGGDKSKNTEENDIETNQEEPAETENEDTEIDIDDEENSDEADGTAGDDEENNLDDETESITKEKNTDGEGTSGETIAQSEEGTFVGLVDSHTIEVQIDGVHGTLSFDEGVQETIFSLEEGKTYQFDYRLSGSGNKIITAVKEK